MATQITGDSLELLFEMLEEEELMDKVFDAETDKILAEVKLSFSSYFSLTKFLFISNEGNLTSRKSFSGLLEKNPTN